MAPRRRLVLCFAALAALAATGSAAAAPTADWTGFLSTPVHSSVSADTTVTPANVAGLSQAWSWMPPVISGRVARTLYSTPDVVNGTVYEGTTNGEFYALDLSTGDVVWKNDLQAYQTKKECEGFGFVASPAAANDPTTGKLTIYDAGGNGYLYALDAATGDVVWKVKTKLPSATQNNYMNWSSPTIANGSIYLGIASNCDNPLIHGQLMKFSQATGKLQHVFKTMPSDTVGGSVWSTAAATSKDVWIGTANPLSLTSPRGDSESIIDLNASTLKKKAIWTVPDDQLVFDGGFGSSPVLFTATIGGVATPMIGDCNKNGKFYAINAQTMTEVWQINVDAGRGPCTAGAIWDGKHLIVAGQQTNIKGVKVPGSIRSLNPATGQHVWQTALGAAVLGTPTESGGGVVAVATWDSSNPNALYFVDPTKGAILRTIPEGTTKEFSQPIFADGYVVTATLDGGLIAYH